MARGGPVLRPRHVPQRTCVACRQGNAKRVLVRVVRGAEGVVLVDLTGKQAGRGAYLCQSPDCWEAALKRDVLKRSLKVDTIAAGDLEQLKAFAAQLALNVGG